MDVSERLGALIFRARRLLSTMSVTPWTELEVEIFGTAGSFANPRPSRSIREALAHEVHSREQAVRGEATARAIADGDLMDRVTALIAKLKADVETSAREVALQSAQRIVSDAQDRSERIVAEAEKRCMQALDARLEKETRERREQAQRGEQFSFLRSALILLFFSLCMAGLLYAQDSGSGVGSGSQSALPPAPPVKDIAMQHAVSAHDVRLVKIESDRHALLQRLNRAETELAEGLITLKHNSADIQTLQHMRSEAVQSALSAALAEYTAALDEREAAQQSWMPRAEADLQGLKDQLSKLQFMIPAFESHVTQLETEFRKQTALAVRMDSYEGSQALQDRQLQKVEQDLARGEHMKRGFRVGDNQFLINTESLVCSNGYTRIGAKCLMLPASRKSFEDARTHCQATGGDLAVIHNDQAWDQHKLLVPGNTIAWVGLQKLRGNGKWQWINGMGGERGDPDGYQNWAPNQPSGDGSCAAARPLKADKLDNLTGDLFAIESVECTHMQYFLCEYGGTIGFEKLSSYYDRP